MHYKAVIVGAGPGGLACANKLSRNGVRTLVIERKSEIGQKVCAGGITWSGLVSRVPEELIELSFPLQNIKTRFQNITVSADCPIIATINRKKLGQFMATETEQNGAIILTSTQVRSIKKNSLEILDRKTGQRDTIHFDYLIGADGSQSMVRRFLQLPPDSGAGIGINYQPPVIHEQMEWHLHTKYFKNGYGWIFPHKDSVSIGAYVDKKVMSAGQLKENLIIWAATQGFDLREEKCSAEYIHFGYQGWDFGHIFLVGDAAGLASALTGEGIYPAIVSGETVAEKILDPQCDLSKINRMIQKQQIFRKMVQLTGKSIFLSFFLAELGLLLLRLKILNFRHLEMGH